MFIHIVTAAVYSWPQRLKNWSEKEWKKNKKKDIDIMETLCVSLVIGSQSLKLKKICKFCWSYRKMKTKYTLKNQGNVMMLL